MTAVFRFSSLSASERWAMSAHLLGAFSVLCAGISSAIRLAESGGLKDIRPPAGSAQGGSQNSQGRSGYFD